MKDVFVYQNTVVRCGTQVGLNYENCGILVDADDPSNSNFVVRNNIVADCPLQIKTKTFSFLTVDNNLLFGTSSTSKPTNPTILFGNPGTNAILENPLFENSATADFRLRTGSPALDKALGTPLSNVDFFDTPRIGKGDLGAIEKSNVVSNTEYISDKTKDIYLSPNPALEEINLEFYGKTGKIVNIEILDICGRIIQSITYMPITTGLNSLSLNLESFANGSYFLTVSDNEYLKKINKFIIAK